MSSHWIKVPEEIRANCPLPEGYVWVDETDVMCASVRAVGNVDVPGTAEVLVRLRGGGVYQVAGGMTVETYNDALDAFYRAYALFMLGELTNG